MDSTKADREVIDNLDGMYLNIRIDDPDIQKQIENEARIHDPNTVVIEGDWFREIE